MAPAHPTPRQWLNPLQRNGINGLKQAPRPQGHARPANGELDGNPGESADRRPGESPDTQVGNSVTVDNYNGLSFNSPTSFTQGWSPWIEGEEYWEGPWIARASSLDGERSVWFPSEYTNQGIGCYFTNGDLLLGAVVLPAA